MVHPRPQRHVPRRQRTHPQREPAEITEDDITKRFIEKAGKIDEAHGDAIERTGALLWVTGDAADLITIAWIVACIETKTPWEDPEAQNLFEKLREVGHWTRTSDHKDRHAPARVSNTRKVACLAPSVLPPLQ